MDAQLIALSKRRVSEIQASMKSLDLDAALLTGTGMSSTILERLSGSGSGTVLVIPAEEDPTLVVMPIDFTYASDHSWVNVSEVSDEASSRRDWTPAVEKALSSVKVRKLGIVAGSLNANQQEEWLKRLGAETADIQKAILEPLFSALDPAEWSFQRRITEIVDVGQKVASEVIRPGMTTNEVAGEIAAAELKAGASGVGYLQVSSGRRSAYSHDSAKDVEIRDGDLLLVDLCPTRDGYGSDETRTYIAGEGSDKAKGMILAVNRSVEAVLSKIELGANAGDLDAVSRKSLVEEGYPSYPHTLGHPLSGCTRPGLRRGSTHSLEIGSIFTVEPGIYAPGYGGVRIEENVLMTRTGPEVLTKRPRILF
jgi:Xaa-Pro dipeptidase